MGAPPAGKKYPKKSRVLASTLLAALACSMADKHFAPKRTAQHSTNSRQPDTRRTPLIINAQFLPRLQFG
jgi:hypothetical protein